MSPVTKISRVLVGVNFDDASASAVKMAGVLASAWDADITAFHAATQDVPAYFTAAQVDVLEAEREQARTDTAGQLRVFAEQNVARAVRVVVGEGPPPQLTPGSMSSGRPSRLCGSAVGCHQCARDRVQTRIRSCYRWQRKSALTSVSIR